MLQQLIAPAVSFGLSAAVIPGPLIAFLVKTTLTLGWRKALLIVLSPLITDAPIIVLMTFILGQLPPALLSLIQFGGGCLLLFIAWGALKQYRAGLIINAVQKDTATDASWQKVLLTGILMNLLSPGPWLFWAAVNGPLLLMALQASPAHALAFLLAFYGSFLGGLCGWVFLLHQARHVRAAYLRYVILAMAILLTWFGLSLIAAALG